MILKASQRKGANDLALHVSNEVDNEKIVIHEIKGAVGNDLYSAFNEWQLIASYSRAEKPFYSLSINPNPNLRDWSEEEWQKAISHIENRLGLTNQPRAIIFHEKFGEDGNIRKHAHVIWSRIKTDNRQFKAIHLSNDYYILRSCAQRLAKEFGLDLPKGLQAD